MYKQLNNENAVSPLLDRKKAALYLGISLSTLDKKINIPRIKICGSIKYLKRDLDEYLEANREVMYEKIC